MRFHEALNEILGNKIQIKLLRILVKTKGSYTGRELAGLINHSQNQTSLALKELERNGLVTWQGVGRAHLYSIDMDNILVSNLLEEAFRLEDSLLEMMANTFFDEIGEDLLFIVLFGSIVRDQERQDSDIDFVLVVKDKADIKAVEEKAAEASMVTTRKFGNQAMPIIVTTTDYDRKTKAKQGFWREVALTGQRIHPDQGRAMSREQLTRQVEKSAARVFWSRAIQCAASMEEALDRKHWEAAGINAVHAAISANDAVLAARKGLKLASVDHGDAARVLMSQLKDEEAQKAGKRLGVIIAKKSRVEYEGKRFTEKEARGIVVDAQRFMKWAEGIIPVKFQ